MFRLSVQGLRRASPSAALRRSVPRLPGKARHRRNVAVASQATAGWKERVELTCISAGDETLMHGQMLLIIVLGVVAIATTVQAVALVSVLLAVRRLEGRFGEAERELRALRPRLERLGRVIDNVADWTDGVAEHIPRVAADIESTLDQLRGIARLGAMMLVKPLRPLGVALALWKGLKSGANVYRHLRPARAPAASPRISVRWSPDEGHSALSERRLPRRDAGISPPAAMRRATGAIGTTERALEVTEPPPQQHEEQDRGETASSRASWLPIPQRHRAAACSRLTSRGFAIPVCRFHARRRVRLLAEMTAPRQSLCRNRLAAEAASAVRPKQM